MYSTTIREEELKNKVAADFFDGFDTTPIIGNIDFCVAVSSEQGTLFNANADGYIESLLWAEAKRGRKNDQQMKESLVQLILTIGRARTFDNNLPPIFLGAFDAEKIAFLPYDKIMPVFSQNDFNWKVTPSNHESREFIQLFQMVEQILDNEALLYRFTEDEKELKTFIHKNLHLGNTNINRVSVNKNNFVTIYNKWVQTVQPTIQIDWTAAKRYGILSGDFFLADLLSEENTTIIEKLFVLLRSNHYILDRKVDAIGFEESKRVSFTDRQKAHKQFWQRYNRPPKEEYWNYIVERRDLLVPQDVRERKGSFFTPQRWVELSQQYIADVLGEDWQDEYYIWDCCAGTGNLLAGLTNKYNIWASTLDKADVEVMRERIANGANLLESHIFQFDFLNDDFSTLPAALQDIISNPVKRCKLVIYINPPYAEAGNRKKVIGKEEHKTDVAVKMNTYQKYLPQIGIAGRELFAQFFARIYFEIPGAVLAEFSTLKILQAPNFADFREIFRAKLLTGFLVPANTFDNVSGQFPIGFFVWNLSQKERFVQTTLNVYDAMGNKLGVKTIAHIDNIKTGTDWLVATRKRPNETIIGYQTNRGNDFQQVNYNYIVNSKDLISSPRGTYITDKNLIESCIYLAVHHVIPATWLNDRDQFLYPYEVGQSSRLPQAHELPKVPNDTTNTGNRDDCPTWYEDAEFQSNCLIYTLFHGQNRITAKDNINHWIPFTEQEVNAKEKFASHFMSDFLQGKHRNTLAPKGTQQGDLFVQGGEVSNFAIKDDTCFKGEVGNSVSVASLSPAAQKVLDAGRELWRYYHEQAGQGEAVSNRLQAIQYNPNASFYDIRLYFQGTDAKGKMNNKSEDEQYNRLLAELRTALKDLAKQIEPKVYQYGFLLGE